MKRLALVTAVATAGFAAALVHFGNADTAQSCLVDAPQDATYSAQFDGGVSMDGTNHVLVVTQGGRPLTGAQVCLNTAVVGMPGMAMTAQATEQAPGRYAVPLQFARSGPWTATVIVAVRGGAQVGVPVSFTVSAGGMSNPPGATPAG